VDRRAGGRPGGGDASVNFFEKYRRENVGHTRARLAELISIFEAERDAMTTRELEELRAEIDLLTERLQAERLEAERGSPNRAP
jgi:hypothetical protein